MENLENKETNIEKNEKVSNDDKPLTRDEFKNMLASFVNKTNENDHKEIPASRIEVMNDYEGIANLGDSFRNWMGKCALGEIRSTFNPITHNVTISVPKQFDPIVADMPGVFGHLEECTRVGDLVSDVLHIERSVSAGTSNWITKTQRSTNSTTGAVSAYAQDVNVKMLDSWVTIYPYQLFSQGYDTVGLVNRAMKRTMPLAIDIEIFTGTGTNFTGIHGDPYVPTVAVGGTNSQGFTHFSLTSSRAMVGKISPELRDANSMKWYVDQIYEEKLLALGDTNNTYEQLVSRYNRLHGSEIVPISSGVFNTTLTASAKHFILANLKEAIHYADLPLQMEVFHKDGNAFDFRFWKPIALGVANPKAACILVQPA